VTRSNKIFSGNQPHKYRIQFVFCVDESHTLRRLQYMLEEAIFHRVDCELSLYDCALLLLNFTEPFLDTNQNLYVILKSIHGTDSYFYSYIFNRREARKCLNCRINNCTVNEDA
jgi:hypothetical protein